MPVSREVDPFSLALTEPFACVLRGQNAVNVRVGDVVVVVGAGPIGVMHIMLAKLRGAAKVIACELNPARLEQTKAFGADYAVTPDALAPLVKEITNGDGADVVITAAPAHKAQEAALEIAGIGGRINYFGGLPKDRPTITFDSNVVHYKELVVTGTTACSTKDCRDAAAIVASGRIDLASLASARFPLAEANAAFAAAQEGKALKIVLEP
jgi:L-iditol 2-dehydrogenase